MLSMERIYHLTEAGSRAAACAHSGLPSAIQELLGTVGGATLFGEITARLDRYDACDILARLEDLEAIGLVESVALEWLAELFQLGTYAPQPLAAAPR